MKRIIFSLLALSSIIGCDKICDTPDLTIARQDNNTNKIRLDGVWHTYNKASLSTDHYFYQNGIVNGGCRNEKPFPEYLECLTTTTLSKGDRAGWAVYVINGNTITLETWRLRDNCNYILFSRTGRILNDTTILLGDLNNRSSTDTFTYKFYRYPFKPDSTNDFIK